MKSIVIFSTKNCSYCALAKKFFEKKKIPFEEVFIDNDPVKREELVRLTGKRTVPQIFINDQSIGGYDDLVALANSGKLEKLLSHDTPPP